MNKPGRILLIFLVFAVFLGSIPMVYAAADHTCACCKETCNCKVYVCHATCACTATIGRSALSPDLELSGTIASPPDSRYRHNSIRTVFHPPNADPRVQS